MFTGIIQDTGKIISISKEGDSKVFVLKSENKDFSSSLKNGDSIAVNGVCLTVTGIKDNSLSFTAVKETLSKTNLGDLIPEEFVNLEQAMSVNSKLDGHMVQGHVDTTGIMEDIRENMDSHEFFISFEDEFRDFIIKIGSISINGVSLTIADITDESKGRITIKTAIIPYTYQMTNFKYLKKGDRVNIEFDMMGKYIKRIFENSIK
ncbi:MAG: riboflavin synthase [Bacteroidetes bacterium]|nr:riboflavin synthase [Bacteroidota bacterium]